MNWILDNWLAIVGTGTLTTIINYIVNKQQQKQLLKKGDVEIDSAEVDYAVKVRELYESLLAQANTDKDALKSDKDAIVNEFKAEKEYFRKQIDELRSQASLMQEQFNSIQIAYAKEVEQSQNWEKLHRELAKENEELKRLYEDLKSLYDKLKAEFEKHKKQKQ